MSHDPSPPLPQRRRRVRRCRNADAGEGAPRGIPSPFTHPRRCTRPLPRCRPRTRPAAALPLQACAVTLTGAPGWAVYCHCSQCRRALGADYATLVGSSIEAIAVSRGEFKSYSTGKEERYSCPTCFATVWADLHHLKARAIYNTAFTTPNHGPDGAITLDAFKPSMHIFYSSGITRVHDALPKFEGLPTAFGGTGVELNNDASKKAQ